MKRRFIKLASVMAMSALLFTACQEEGVAPDENSITAAIEKIETSYVEGDIKELTYDGVKIETRASAELIKKRIEQQIEEQRSSLEHSSSHSRLGQTDYDVGIIPNTNWCPIWSEMITFHMDCEDHHPRTEWRNPYNWKGSWEVTGDKDLTMRYCRVDGRKFKKLAFRSYAVLRLGNSKPPGATTWQSRTFDNEDKRNANWSSGNKSPNLMNKYSTTLSFWVFESGSGPINEFPDLTVGYGVIGKGGGSWTSSYYTNSVHVDDEDNGNANDWDSGGPIGFYYGLSGDADTDIEIHRIK